MTNAQKFTAAYKHSLAVLPNMILDAFQIGGFEDESEIVDFCQAKFKQLKYPVPEKVYIYDAIYHFKTPR